MMKRNVLVSLLLFINDTVQLSVLDHANAKTHCHSHNHPYPTGNDKPYHFATNHQSTTIVVAVAVVVANKPRCCLFINDFSHFAHGGLWDGLLR